jgi:transcriptional regulator with XRE-family HTH domain
MKKTKITFSNDMLSNREKAVKLFQENLWRIRYALGLTQSDIAKTAGLSKQMISNIELNRNKLEISNYIVIRLVIYKWLQIINSEALTRYVLTILNEPDETYWFSNVIPEIDIIKPFIK